MVVGGVGVEVQGGEKMRRSIRGWEKEKVKPAGQGQRNGKGRGQRAEGRGQRAEGRDQRAEDSCSCLCCLCGRGGRGNLDPMMPLGIFDKYSVLGL
jgi:hypothetical protein